MRRIIIFVSVSLLLFAICILPSLPYIHINSTFTIRTGLNGIHYASVKNIKVTQKLNVPGKLEQLAVYVSAPNAGYYEEANIILRIIEEGEMIQEKTYKANEIKDGWLNFGSISEAIQDAEVVLSVESNGIPSNMDFFVILTDDPYIRMDDAQMNGDITGYKAIIDCTYSQYNTAYWCSLVTLCIIIAIILCFSYILGFRPEWIEKKLIGYWLTAGLVFCTMVLKNPTSNVLSGAMSEAVYEFWQKAKDLGFFGSLMSLMSGESLVWLERVVIWISYLIAPTAYVFHAAQILEMLFIAFSTAMFTLPTFRKYIAFEVRLVVSIYCGCYLLFTNAYYLWSISYWCSFFIVLYAFVDKDKISTWKYYLSLLFTVILCVSRIYHILYIVMFSLAILLQHKEISGRQKGYYFTVIIASAFEVIYSFAAGAGNHISGSMPPLLTLINNTLYYQAQTILSLLTGGTISSNLGINITAMIIFFCVFGAFIVCLIKKQRKYATIIGAMGVLSIGSIFINVFTSGTSNSVGFPLDYSAPISWEECYYQIADLHFSYSYISLVMLILLFFHATTVMGGGKIQTDTKLLKTQGKTRLIGVLVFVYLIAISPYGPIRDSIFQFDWPNEGRYMDGDSYYMAVNASVGVADISLVKNSYPIIYGIDTQNEGVIWHSGDPFYSTDIPYVSADVGSISELEQRRLLSITARRKEYMSQEAYYVVLYDRNKQVIDKVCQSTKTSREWINFYPETKPYNVYTISFEYEDGTPAYIIDGLQLGVSTLP